MKRKLSALVLAGTLLAINVLGGSGVSAANTDNFVIKNFEVTMDLNRDETGHSTLRTVEAITAEFPTTNQNQGLERTMIKKYDRHRTDFELISVTDGNGRALPYYWDGDTLWIGEKDEYVHGTQTYRITYTQRDITKVHQDTGRDEFYWDVIGTEWRVPIEQVSAKILVAPGLRDRILENPRCYVGYQQGTDICQINEFDGTYLLSAKNIGSGRGLTVAFGFMPQTFIGYQATLGERLLALLAEGLLISNLVIGPVVLLIGTALLFIRYRQTKRRHRKAIGTAVVPEYLPPRGRTLSENARVWSPNFFTNAWTGRLISAQLMAWAVAQYAEFQEAKKKTLFRAAQYTITFKESLADLPELDQRMAKLVTGSVPRTGDSVTTDQLRKRSKKIYQQLRGLDEKITSGDLYEKAAAFERRAGRLKVICIILGVLLLNVPIIILAVIAWSFQRQIFVSEAGERLRRHLEGLKMFISITEEERLEILRNSGRTEKIGDVANDQGLLVRLYERLLPYAILFGQEKEWTRQLGKMYEVTQVSPGWMAGRGAYSATAMTGFMNGLSTSMTGTSQASNSSDADVASRRSGSKPGSTKG